MARFITAAALTTSFNKRNPAPTQPAVIADLQASGTVDKLEAQAVRGYSQVSGKLQYVKASEHFFVAGELIQAGDYVEVTEDDAKRLRNAGRAEYATTEEVGAAQKAAKGK